MKRVCLDNHILIWGVRGVSTSGQEQQIEQARQLFEDLDQSDARVMIPSVVVAEFLAGVPKPQHGNLLDVLNRRFQIPPFDTRTAALAAELWREAAERNPHLKDQVKEAFPGTEKAKIKADIMILATALARNADILYTHDGPLAKVAEGRIDVRQLPPLRPKQADLPLE
jgi:predicted nucleic acid-binding protein